jgi:hypothetical protein
MSMTTKLVVKPSEDMQITTSYRETFKKKIIYIGSAEKVRNRVDLRRSKRRRIRILRFYCNEKDASYRQLTCFYSLNVAFGKNLLHPYGT